jgi:RHS repeat-associated protein
VELTVTIPGGNAYSRTFGLTFQNGKGATNVPQTTITTSSLNGVPFGAPTGFANTTVTGGTYTESQTITLSNASGGTWRVAYNGEVSAALSPTITAAQLKSTLDGFNGINNVTVTGSSGSFTVTFGGTQSTTNMQQIFGDAANASNGSTVRTITTAYDAADQITSVSDPSSTINYTLDNLGRATTVAQVVNGLTPTVTLNQAFDAMNNRMELKATIASTLDFKNTYQYDKLQRLTDIVQQGQSGGNSVTAKHITQSFNALSQRTQIARYQSTGTTNAVATTDFTFDTANRLSGIAHKQGAMNLNTYAYTYDPLSRIATIVSTLEGTDTYSYDQTSQLVGATHTSHGNETYGFDANGNRNTSGFTTGANNQTTAGLGFTYTYDDEGNRTSKTETSTGKVEEYTWDHRNRLTKVVFRNSSGGAIVKQVDYEYDAYNRLVRRTFDADGAGAGAATNQYWVYDEGINAVLQFDGSSASNLSHRYLWSDNVDELLADEQLSGSNTLWGLADHLGSLRDIADYSESTGVTTIANHRTINSFGKLISETNAAVDMLFAFTGKQFDEATGLQHNLFRWLDPNLGQWLNEDPIGFGAGDENVRRYVGNKTVNSIDPSGLQEPFVDQRMPIGERCTGSWPDRVPPNPQWPTIYPTRPLTPGEIALLQDVFQGHLNTDGLYIIIGSFPLSGRNTVVPRYTPWFPPENYSSDFSQETGRLYRHFIHEMTHVLQSQQGNYNYVDATILKFYYFLSYENAYPFDLESLGRPLYTFNLEQQAEIISMYFTDNPYLRIPRDYRCAAWVTIGDYQTQPPPLRPSPVAWPIYLPGSNPNPYTP